VKRKIPSHDTPVGIFCFVGGVLILVKVKLRRGVKARQPTDCGELHKTSQRDCQDRGQTDFLE